jgi:hypothetical protein
MAGNGNLPTLEATPGKEFARLRREGVVLLLPSGFKARVRPVNMGALLKLGRIPDTLSGLAAEVLWQGVPRPDTVLHLGKGAFDLLEIVVASAFMEPIVVVDREPENDNEVSIDDIDFEDQQFLFAWVTAPTSALRRFRDEQARDVAAVQSDQDEQPAAQPHTAGR